MTAPTPEQPDDVDIDASLALDGFDASDRYPEYGHSALRAAYRSGWADVVAAIRDSGYTVIALPEADESTGSRLKQCQSVGCLGDMLTYQRDAALATLARIQAVAADVDQDGGHSGPSLARHILNIIGGEA